MRKTYSILDQYGGVTQQFTGTAMVQQGEFVLIYDLADGNNKAIYPYGDYLKAVHRLADGTTISHTEEVNG